MPKELRATVARTPFCHGFPPGRQARRRIDEVIHDDHEKHWFDLARLFPAPPAGTEAGKGGGPSRPENRSVGIEAFGNVL
ncbi:hypothetical protein ACMT1E_03120 [Sphingomonas flavalba]|uniref:hypothetical protein n=1 Tax=Sphingomonas flavalba TaxID=2559804 RepID=UPI0039DFFF7F